METTDPLKKVLREKLGEMIPADGDQSASFFTDTQIEAMLSKAKTMDHAIVEGWEIKMAHWANLVTVVDGASSRELTELMNHATKMINYYQGKVDRGENDILTRTRIGKIVRDY